MPVPIMLSATAKQHQYSLKQQEAAVKTSSESFKELLSVHTNKQEAAAATPKAFEKTYEIPEYTTDKEISKTFLDVATDNYERKGYSPEQIREIAYYKQLSYEIGKELNELANDEFETDNGLTKDEIHNLLEPLRRQQYAIQDFLQDKFNLNGTNNDYTFGLDRDSLGFNESKANPTYEEFDTKNKLVSRFGYTEQTAVNMAYGFNGSNVFKIENGNVVDTGQPGEENIYDHVGNHSYFNDPRNAGKTFNWMSYINPAALQGEVKTDGKIIDYYYATNFAYDHRLDNSSWNGVAPFDWKSHSHEELIERYGVARRPSSNSNNV